VFRSSTFPLPVAVDTAALAFTPQDARLTAFTAKIGASDVRATGSLENLAGWMLPDRDLRGPATGTSAHFDVNEWRSRDKTTEIVAVPPHVDLSVDAWPREVRYGLLKLADR